MPMMFLYEARLVRTSWMSRSGPFFLGVLAVTVWSAFGRFSCHGEVLLLDT